ncbi:hypothetical protein MicloDRAFT_00053040 [Microvirga lotononidis]|uniref:Uncharacterized protein n=1 Tax=Microvirga lotononidis TaxID=864069 RepID=I4YKU7_9HYPH|nr:hypothetical protein MicloDRAFT_00053040 [Microvirga lotononidis]
MIIVSILRLVRSIVSDTRRMQREAARRYPNLNW